MARLSDDEALALLSPDFQGLLDARKVGKGVQAELYRIGVDTMQMFSAVATDRAGLATLAKDSLGIDPATTAADAIKLASLYLAWQSASKRVKVQDELDADHSAQKMPKSIPASEMMGLKDQFEASYYALRDAEMPGRSSFEDLCEQLDAGELRPMALRHFGSRADDEEAEVGALQLGKSGQVRIKRNKIETAVPTNGEELRLKITLMGNHWLFAKFRYPNKPSLQGLTPFVFMEFTNYLMGKHVAQMEAQTIDGITLHRPSTKLLVNYEYQMRKEVVENYNNGTSMHLAFKTVVKNSDVRERYFSTPLAVSSASQSMEKVAKEGGRNTWSKPMTQGKGKGKKGKGGGGKGKDKSRISGVTPDGRQICFAWNNKDEGCSGGCNRVHCCRLCLSTQHPMYEHPKGGPGGGAANKEWLPEQPGKVLKILYLFSGAPRRTGLACQLRQQFSKSTDFTDVSIEEWDISRGSDFDLSPRSVQEALLERIRTHEFDAIILSPPCAGWSRAPWANPWGPRPLRAAGQHVWGFPWLEGARKQKLDLSNNLVLFSLEVMQVALEIAVEFLFEHPEDLGAVRSSTHRVARPASVWQLPQMRQLGASLKVYTFAFYQCQFGASSRKPTRFITTFPQLALAMYSGWPVFDQLSFYQGPLPPSCTCARRHVGIIKRHPDDSFATSLAQAYPPAMDAWMAQAILQHFTAPRAPSLKRAKVGAEGAPIFNPGQASSATSATLKEGVPISLQASSATLEEGVPISLQASSATLEEGRPISWQVSTATSQEKEKKEEGSSSQCSPLASSSRCEEKKEGGSRGGLSLAPTTSASSSTASSKGDGGSRGCCGIQEGGLMSGTRLGPVQVSYKGRVRNLVDGLGKNSWGIRPAGHQGSLRSKEGQALADAFVEEVHGWLGAKSKVERLRLLAVLALGKIQGSPFSGEISAIRDRLDKKVRELGGSPSRRSSDRVTEINFRRLLAWSRILEDEDVEYLEGLAARGVPLGLFNDIPRVREVYDDNPKLQEPGSVDPGWSEKEGFRENYTSAEDHIQKVEEHLEEDVEKGWLVKVSLEEARRMYPGEDLQLASLGAVPKDPDWEDIRVVHDGTHGISLNTSIKQPNRMAFPQFDDLEACLRSFRESGAQERFLLAFDIKAAHRLVPVRKEDWGRQGCRGSKGDVVYLNTRGTFGVASAAFWWGRVAGTCFRALHRVLPRSSLFYLLLFADDGLILSGGPHYQFQVLAVLLFLEVMEMPLSWKKCRGGFETEWIGYQVDLRGRCRSIGIPGRCSESGSAFPSPPVRDFRSGGPDVVCDVAPGCQTVIGVLQGGGDWQAAEGGFIPPSGLRGGLQGGCHGGSRRHRHRWLGVLWRNTPVQGSMVLFEVDETKCGVALCERGALQGDRCSRACRCPGSLGGLRERCSLEERSRSTQGFRLYGQPWQQLHPRPLLGDEVSHECGSYGSGKPVGKPRAGAGSFVGSSRAKRGVGQVV